MNRCQSVISAQRAADLDFDAAVRRAGVRQRRAASMAVSGQTELRIEDQYLYSGNDGVHDYLRASHSPCWNKSWCVLTRTVECGEGRVNKSSPNPKRRLRGTQAGAHANLTVPDLAFKW
eukprot:2023451-Pleurochrysis_carterae.AAC.1